MIRPVPRFEPEVIAAGARRFRGDADKVPTTAFGTLTLRGYAMENRSTAAEDAGITVTSRYGKAHEVDRLVAIVTALPDDALRLVRTISCDSKAGDSYGIVTHPCSPDDLLGIASQVSIACHRLAGGHNGILVHSGDGCECSIASDWSGAPKP